MTHLNCLLLMLLLSAMVATQTAPLSDIITKSDYDRFKALAEKSLSQSATQDLSNLFYASNLAKQINHASTSAKQVCEHVQSRIDDQITAQGVYYIAGINKALSCAIASEQFEKVIKSVEGSDVKMQDFFYGVHAASNLGVSVSLATDALMKKLVSQLTENDVSLAAQVYGVQVASIISTGGTSGGNAAALEAAVFSLVEDIVGQADEVNDKYLQLEGGLGITSLFIEGAFNLAAKMNKAPIIIPSKLQQLSNYIMSRKDNQNAKSAYFVMMAAQVLSNNKYLVPTAVTLVSPRAMSSAEGGKVQFKVSNLMGGPVSGVSGVVADQVNRPSDGAILVNKETLTASSDDKSVYELDLLKLKPHAGFYTVSVSLHSHNLGTAKLVGVAPGNAKLDVKVTSEVLVTNMNVAVIDAESMPSATKGSQIQHPDVLKTTLSADSSQKVVASFAIKDKLSNADFEPHQVFMRLVHIESQTETFFVCEKSGASYEFEMKVKSNENALKSLIGDYEMHLIVGDAVITNSFMWLLGKISFHFSDGKSYEEPSYAADYQPKPEIHHMFRQPDPRPAVVFSQAFALLTVAPLALLLALWAKLEVNVSCMQFDLPTIGFHGGLAAIFGLYYCYWAHLNMFQTLKGLSVIGAVTFFCGHKLLKKLALARLNNSRAVGG